MSEFRASEMSTSVLFNVHHDVVIEKLQSLYERTEKSLNEDVEKLKEWMTTQPHIPEILSEKVITNFLIRSKCSVEKTKQRIDMYYTIRSQIPEFFENISPEGDGIRAFMQSAFWVPLPKAMCGIYRVFLFKIRNQELFEKIDPVDLFKYMYDLWEIRAIEDTAFGEVAIFDFEKISLKYLVKLTPVFLAKCFAVYEKSLAIPLKGIFFINSPPYANTGITMLKKLLKPKLAARIHVCENTSILAQNFDEKMLPQDYGGEEKTLEELQELVEHKFAEYRDRFEILEKLRVDENLRPEKLEDDDILGFYGNFKKLELD